MQQMMELLRKELRAEREAAEKRADDRFKAWREKTAAMREELVAETEATREETGAIQARTEAMREKMGTSHMEMVSEFKPEIEEDTMACREATEARLEEEKPASVDTKPAAAQQEEVPLVIPVGEPEEEMTSINRKKAMACQEMEERLEEQPTPLDRKPEAAEQRQVPVEDAELMPVGEPKKKRRRDRKQRNMKNSTRENWGPQKKLAVARRGTSRCMEVAWQKKTSRKMSRRATVAWRRRNIFREILTHGNCGLQKKVTVSRRRITRCTGHRHMERNEDARKEGRSGRDCGRARKATLA
jgi:hypothetical protein